jgi:hypothetical protein
MLDEAKKREKVANAFLAATMAASAAQSPKDFLRTGHIEAPGTALMQMWAKKRGEAERNLDSGRVSHPARNKKKDNVKEAKMDSILPMLLLMMMKKAKEKKKRSFLAHEETKMKKYQDFILECYYLQEDAGDAFVNMSDADFERYKKAQPSTAAFAEKKRKEAQARSQKETGQKTSTDPNRYQRARQKVKDIYNRAKTAKDNASQTYQNVKDTVKNKAKQAASKAYNTSPKDAVNAAKQATANAKNAAKQAVSDASTKVKYGRTVRPDTTGASALAKRSSALSNVSKASKVLRVAGRVAGPAAAALDVASEKSKGSGWARSLAKGAVTAAGGALGGAAGSAAGPVGTVVGGAAGATAASKAFDVAAGKNAVERAADRQKNRQRQAGGALVGTGGKTTFDTKKNTMTTGNKTVNLAKTSAVKDPKTGKQETGYLAYKGGKAVYKRADKPGTGSSNAFERIGRTINPNAYKANDAKLAAQKLNKAKQNDASRNQSLGIKPKK